MTAPPVGLTAAPAAASPPRFPPEKPVTNYADAWEMERLRRLIAERLARFGDEGVGWCICLVSQFPPPTDEPSQAEIDRWFSPQE
jgi:hypothetical protein